MYNPLYVANFVGRVGFGKISYFHPKLSLGRTYYSSPAKKIIVSKHKTAFSWVQRAPILLQSSRSLDSQAKGSNLQLQSIQPKEVSEFSEPPESNEKYQKPLKAHLDQAIEQATNTLIAQQNLDGHWRFHVECFVAMPVEYIVVLHYIGERNPPLEKKIAKYLLRNQRPEGGWALVPGGELNVTETVKAYFALKLIGESQDSEPMTRARKVILQNGGVEACNVFTRFQLALFGIVPWKAIPRMPIELMLLPKWFPFHIHKIGCWARTTLVPMMVLRETGRQARNPGKAGIPELFTRSSSQMGLLPRAGHQSFGWFWFFRGVDALLGLWERFHFKGLRARARAAALEFIAERNNGEDGLGGISPSMNCSLMMYDALEYATDHPLRVLAKAAVDKLVVEGQDEAYTTVCLSPKWDTALAAHALLEVGDSKALDSIERGLAWLRPLQILDVKGDWTFTRPNLRPGGWAFQYTNDYYPDMDDTSVVVKALDRMRKINEKRSPTRANIDNEAINRAIEWIIGMETIGGGWGAFDTDNTYAYLDNIPFADQPVLRDPPTIDVSSRCLGMMSQLGYGPECHPVAAAGLDFILREQEKNGSWYGRWGINYIYGTWSALVALNAAGLPHDHPAIRKAIQWLFSIQNPDGGWGEEVTSYKLDYSGHVPAKSRPSQTAWAILGLMAVGEGGGESVRDGVNYLLRTQSPMSGQWDEEEYTGNGHPNVLYLRYHGYRKYFPLFALARYRNLMGDGFRSKVPWGL